VRSTQTAATIASVMSADKPLLPEIALFMVPDGRGQPSGGLPAMSAA